VDLFFCGYGYPIRLHILELIAGALAASRELAFFGPNLSEAIGQIALTQRLTTEQFAETCTHALLTLNIGRDLNIANDQFNIVAETPGPRTFDVALAGGPQLLFDDGLKIDSFYDRDREIILFDSVDDVADSIGRLRRDPDLCTEIATAAQIRTQADHLYEHRIHTMMSTIGAAPVR
jgi:spore maturation protein CgeB